MGQRLYLSKFKIQMRNPGNEEKAMGWNRFPNSPELYTHTHMDGRTDGLDLILNQLRAANILFAW